MQKKSSCSADQFGFLIFKIVVYNEIIPIHCHFLIKSSLNYVTFYMATSFLEVFFQDFTTNLLKNYTNWTNIMWHCKIVQSLQKNSQLQNLLLSIVIIQAAASVQSKFCSIFHLVDRELTVVVVAACSCNCNLCSLWKFSSFFFLYASYVFYINLLIGYANCDNGKWQRREKKNWNRSSSSWNCATRERNVSYAYS